MNLITVGQLQAALLDDIKSAVDAQTLDLTQYVDSANAYGSRHLVQAGCEYALESDVPQDIKRYVIDIAHHQIAVATNTDKDYSTATGQSHLSRYADIARDYFEGLSNGHSVPPCARNRDVYAFIGVDDAELG